MREILRELYRGEVRVMKGNIKRGSEIDTAMKELCNCEDKLHEILSEDGRVLLSRFDRLHHKISDIEGEETFVSAMRFGFGLAMELTSEEDENYCDD